MSKRQQGFSIVEVVVVIMAVIVLGIVGWFVWNSQKDSHKPSKSASKTSNSNKNDPDPYEGWLTYTNGEYGYGFKYPDDWKTSDAANQRGVSPGQPNQYSLTLESPDLVTTNEGVGFHLTDGAEMYVAVVNTDKTTPVAYIESHDFLNRVATDRKEIVLSGLRALRYSLHYEGSPSLATIFVSKGRAYTIYLNYATNKDLNVYQNDYEKLVQSFSLND